MADFCEAMMILFFGLSWPTSVYKSYVSRTAKGKTAVFEVLILIGYIFGIARKFIQLVAFRKVGATPGFLFYFAWFFYVFNLTCIVIDLVLYARNKRLDAEKEKK